ncbi:hypothetical protein EN859_009190 [Mesorhizobium sp. M00.F.Ca.ET.216.01.1.1]|nr:hypothetical protein EN859_009190 [Mesorhizobium sp. M00.F.Ca.ET.216.01.1.1]TJW13563.1 MAG: hypothetical protein E5W82_12875 [Mesorhizobium sp.]TJW49070.1 MAG: hypothetical protein E5W83_00025 [Mesorhizobium sp.]
MTPKIGTDFCFADLRFGKDHAPNQKCYSVLCASKKTRRCSVSTRMRSLLTTCFRVKNPASIRKNQ